MNMTMMNTKKGRAWFVPGLVVLPVLLFYLSFFRGEEMGSSPGRQLELQTFQSGDERKGVDLPTHHSLY